VDELVPDHGLGVPAGDAGAGDGRHLWSEYMKNAAPAVRYTGGVKTSQEEGAAS